MPGNPHECRVNAAQFSKLARNAVTSECDALFALADTWKRLAAELEACFCGDRCKRFGSTLGRRDCVEWPNARPLARA